MKKALFLLSIFATMTSYGAEFDCPDEGPVARANCLGQKLGKADIELKKIFAKAIASINSKDTAHIPQPEREKWRSVAETSQRNWEAHLLAECEEVTRYLWWGGSGSEAAVVECKLEKTQQRILELRRSYGIRK